MECLYTTMCNRGWLFTTLIVFCFVQIGLLRIIYLCLHVILILMKVNNISVFLELQREEIGQEIWRGEWPSFWRSGCRSTSKLQSNLRFRPSLISNHLSSVTSFPKYQKFPSQITISGTSRTQAPLVSDRDHF